MQVNCTIHNVKSLEGRNGKPGIIKCELESTEEKIEVLRAKQQIREFAPSIWIRGSKPHAERLMDMNNRAILSMLYNQSDASEWRVAANGRLVMKDRTDEYNEPFIRSNPK